MEFKALQLDLHSCIASVPIDRGDVRAWLVRRRTFDFENWTKSKALKSPFGTRSERGADLDRRCKSKKESELGGDQSTGIEDGQDRRFRERTA